jgi:AhpD family alkylhydroperoxidase
MKNPATILQGVVPAVQGMYGAMYATGVDAGLLELVHLRVSQVNGCSACVSAGVGSAKKHGETDERLHQVAAWRESGLFSETERSVLALAEAATRMADRVDAVSDDVWEEAAAHLDEEQLAAVVTMIALTNFFNRVNATVREPAGATWG